jgi:hypothetical protein
MKHKRWQALVMVAFAWVLWTEFISEVGGSIISAIEGFETKTKCDAYRKNLAKRLSGNNFQIGINQFGQTNYKEFGSNYGVTFQCLPATNIDPRPRSKK